MSMTPTKTLSPRRGKTSSMATSDKKNIVLASGELFIEYPNTGLGSSGEYHMLLAIVSLNRIGSCVTIPTLRRRERME